MGDKTEVVKWPKGKALEEFRTKVARCKYYVEYGTVIAIDPASRQAGWAKYRRMKLVDSGTIEMSASKPINQRLHELYDKVAVLGAPDILAIEHIKGSRSHDYLKYAVGVALAGCRCPEVIFVPIPAWKAVAKTQSDYSKDDENDAKMIGLTVNKMWEELK